MATVLPRSTVPSAAELVLQTLARSGAEGAMHEFWLFAGEPRRRATERELAAAGWHVRLHSAFKPLVSELLERRAEVERFGIPTAFTVAYPTHPAAAANRFRLEAYPLSRLVERWWPGASLTFARGPLPSAASHVPPSGAAHSPAATSELRYTVRIVRPGGEGALDVFAPNRVVRMLDREALTPCGWWRVTLPDGTVARSEPWETDYERLYRLVLEAVVAQPWSGRGPHFDQLRIEVEHDGIELRLPVGHDRLDTAEALHEELYFSLLERFTRLADLPDGDRRLQPGQIVPLVRNVIGGKNTVSVATVRVSAREKPSAPSPPGRTGGSVRAAAGAGRRGVAADRPGRALGPEELARLREAPTEPDVLATVLDLPGERLSERTARGRMVHGVWRPGTRPAVILNGGQHANETSGVVGALRAARELIADPDAGVGVVALENPDGYALHAELCARVHAEHMHHAARYSALGDDLEHRSDEAPFESAVRRRLMAKSGAGLLVNLHGYPAHEWVRPLTGYLPHKFEWWAVPQGFILIARYQPGFGELAERLLRVVAREVQEAVPALVAFNTEQLAAYAAHAGKLLFPLEGGVPLVLSEVKRPGPAVQVITEYPDETVHGREFVLAHEVQYRATVAAAREWWETAVEWL
ncbi:MAG: hypothetical protein M9914_02895 [Trueperaceae bacterium]|nr:hypothetical protein [Trueperaceae bacterium]